MENQIKEEELRSRVENQIGEAEQRVSMENQIGEAEQRSRAEKQSRGPEPDQIMKKERSKGAGDKNQDTETQAQ